MEKLPFNKKVIYAIGQLGWSIAINVINLQLVYFYLPPEDANIPIYISQWVFLGVLNIVTLILVSGRLFDAVTDPIIASMSDNWKGKHGRRIPFMRFAAIPTVIFFILLFFPISEGQSVANIIWLVMIQFMFYLFLTIYLTPYFALIPELGHNADERLSISTWISITYALGIMVASLMPAISDGLINRHIAMDTVQGIQYAVVGLGIFAGICMLVPAFFINEKKYTNQLELPKVSMVAAMKRSFANVHFRYYVAADFGYFIGITIVLTGLLYYITVLLKLDENMMGVLLPIMVLLSFIFYPFVNILAKRFGKKPFVVGSFIFMGLLFGFIFFLGKLPILETTQAYILVVCMAIPISFLGILPNAILADIAQFDTKKTGIAQEGMYFAARTLMQKFGQTFGVFFFAILTTFGKDIGDDLGIRLSGILGAILCLLAGFYFISYNEKEVMS